jgi:hypothetical protein
MADHGHDNVKADRTVRSVEFAFAPRHTAVSVGHTAVSVGAAVRFATERAPECDRCLRLLMVGTVVVEASVVSEAPR